MRKILGWLCAIAWMAFCLGAQDTAPAKKKTSSVPKKSAASSATSASKKPATRKKTAAPKAASKETGEPKKSASPAKSTAPSKTAAKTTVASKAPAKSAAASKAPGKKKTGGKKTASAKSAKRKPVTTWRNRQTAPAPERYKEIQDALAAKGYLGPEEATGGWGPSSVDALKRFQAAQNLTVTGKIDSLSLIALGLGPKHDAPAAAKPAEEPPVPER
ncbi:MAG: peptidoglycan-binding domain-containing protein [Bryobacteraceae bacterium]|jgi:hypothetical protein